MDKTGATVAFPRHLQACERDKDARLELLAHPSRPHCLFSDVNDFWRQPVRELLESFREKETLKFENIKQAVLASSKSTTTSAHCVIHRQRCQLRRGRCHWAGPPCVDWSSMGPQKRDSGKTIIDWGAWAACRRQLQEPMIIIENSDRYDTTIYVKVFGDLYHVESAIICPTRLGFCGRRSRSWA
eukprot:2436254-Lingulodinium_polyedra.AAC.1